MDPYHNLHSGSNLSTLTETHGIVYRKNKGSYDIRSAGQTITCTLATSLWKELAGQYSTRASRPQKNAQALEMDPIAVGDAVRIVEEADGQGKIVELLPRENRFSRRSPVPMPGAHAFEQVIAANVGQIVPVFAAANPAPHWNMLDRYLVAAESFNLPALICITKLDLVKDGRDVTDADLQAIVDEYRAIGYTVQLVSAQTGEGLAEIKDALTGRVSVFLGKSGVGKTSLLNAIQPGLGQRVCAVSDYNGKGRHTTTYQEMFPLDFGGAVVDTPGVREFGLWDVEGEDLALFFPEMRPYLGRCKFGADCRHDEEPGCAVRKAVMAGQISPRRYQSYMRLQEGD